MSCEELVISIEEYNTQLTDVSLALQQNELKIPDKQKLEELQQNLLQILELTLDQLQQQKQVEAQHEHQQLNSPHSGTASRPEKQHDQGKSEEEIRLEEELALFKSEIAELEGDTERTDSTVDSRDSHAYNNSSAQPLHTAAENNGNRKDKKTIQNNTFNKDHNDINFGSEEEEDQEEEVFEEGLVEEYSTADISSLLRRKRPSHGGFAKAWTAEEVQRLEGAEVRAPFTEQWGGHTYHNALVMSVGSPETGELDLACPEVVVLFRQPTCPAMLPCKFFLSGTCHYMDGSCQYSHGYTVLLQDIRPYCPPDENSLASGSKVLCQHDVQKQKSLSKKKPSSSLSCVSSGGRQGGGRSNPDLWHPGTVQDVLQLEQLVSVECKPCKLVVQCQLQGVVLSPGDDEGEDHDEKPGQQRQAAATTAAGECDATAGEGALLDSAGSSAAVAQQQWLLNPPVHAGVKLGDWEKHTKGIGSRLMQLMGYVAGTGLGKDGEGRVDPVPAYLYPVGVSLDRCMELREKGGGEDLLQVEKRLKREQQQQEKRILRDEERLRAHTSLFDIINNELAGSGKPAKKRSSTEEAAEGGINVGRAHLQQDSSKALNMKGYQLDSRVRIFEKEISQLTQSRDRQKQAGGGQSNPETDRTVAQIEARLREKQEELRDVRRAEDRVTSEQNTRREKKKYLRF